MKRECMFYIAVYTEHTAMGLEMGTVDLQHTITTTTVKM
jgi:hypothetical protein